MANFVNAVRLQTSVLSGVEGRVLPWLAARMPARINSDHLTGLAGVAMLGAGLSYAAAPFWPAAILLVNVWLAINWFGDSLDGTLARVRRKQRPRYGFYVDHALDCVGSTALLVGLGLSGYMHLAPALALLTAYLLVSAETYLATYTRQTFRMSFLGVGPTELRILLAAGNIAAFQRPEIALFGHTYLWFDLAAVVGTVGLGAALVAAIVRNTRALYREEPI